MKTEAIEKLLNTVHSALSWDEAESVATKARAELTALTSRIAELETYLAEAVADAKHSHELHMEFWHECNRLGTLCNKLALAVTDLLTCGYPSHDKIVYCEKLVAEHREIIHAD